MSRESSPFRFGTVQVVTVSAVSAATSNAFGAQTRVIRVASTTDCHIKIGDAPTATTSDHVLPAGVVEYIVVDPSDKLAAIQVAGGGSLSVTELTK